MFKTKAILFVCALVLLVGAIPSFVHADGEYVIVAMIQHNSGYQCRHMPQAEWDAHIANNTLPVGVYYRINATLQELNAQHIWGMHASLDEVQQALEKGWPCRWEVIQPPNPGGGGTN